MYKASMNVANVVVEWRYRRYPHSRSCNMYKQLSLYVDISNKILSISSSYLLQKYPLLQFASATWYRIDSSISYHISYQWFSISSCHTMYQLYDTTLMQTTIFLPSCHQKQILWLKLWYPILRMYHTSIHNNLATSRCRKMMCRHSSLFYSKEKTAGNRSSGGSLCLLLPNKWLKKQAQKRSWAQTQASTKRVMSSKKQAQNAEASTAVILGYR